MDELVKLARGMNHDLQARAIISMAPTNPAINEAQEAMDSWPSSMSSLCRGAIVRERGSTGTRSPRVEA